MAKHSPKGKSVYLVQRIKNEWIHTLGIFSTLILAKAEVNEFINRYGFEGYPKTFERYSPNGWRKQLPNDDWEDVSFYILKYELDVGSSQLEN